ncbi:MAG TPA: hypothetical protein VFZ65_02325 [Planctomycetota bacterium]|nr:hypothetical protein [Planctomycetota bacterium]
MKRSERDLLVEAALTPQRGLHADGTLRFHPAFFDLDEAGREQLFTQLWQQRALEAAASPGGLSATARAVLRRIRGR